MDDARTRVLEAACHLVGRQGLGELHFDAVAKEADLPPEDVILLFPSRLELLEQAFDYADGRATARFAERVRSRAPRERLVQLMTIYFEDDSEIREDWIFWIEMEAQALFDRAIRDILEERLQKWVAMVTGMIEMCVSDGSIPAATDPSTAAQRLMWVEDSLGRQRLMGMATRDQARTEMIRAIEHELGGLPEVDPA